MAKPDGKLRDIEERVLAGERVDRDDLARLYQSDDILGIGRMANFVRQAKNGNRTYFVVNLHINPTNICVNRCRFCAFSRSPGEDGAYVMPLEEIRRRAEAAVGTGITEVHIVGGLHPELPFDYYLDVLRTVREVLPDVHLQAYTAVEIAYFADISGLSLEKTLERLREAGLGSIPGGGAEVFAPRVRQEVCPRKISGERWLEVMRTAHSMGIRSNATMLYGHVETIEERVDHLLALRQLQDETGGFMAYIPLAFHPQNTGLADLPPTTGFDDLKALAIGRIALDNFDHVKAFWIMLGLKVAQLSLWFGADDLDGTVVEERITHAAGADTPQALPRAELVRLIEEAGRVPVERDTLYNVVRR